MCFVAWATADTEEELDLFEQNFDTFVSHPKMHAALKDRIKEGVFEEATWLHEIKDTSDYCEKICFARVLIPTIEKNFLEAYQLYLELNYKLSNLCDLPPERRTLNWNTLAEEVAMHLSVTQKADADSAFEFYKKHKTYKEYDYPQDGAEENEEIPGSLEVPVSTHVSESTEGSVHSDDTSLMSDEASSEASNSPRTLGSVAADDL